MTRIAVGPSAPPMMPMDAAIFWIGVPSVGIHWKAIADSAKAIKMPSCAAAPRIRLLGFAIKGPKSVIAPTPMKIRHG